MGIPDNAFVVGHLGRLAPEKNLVFLAKAVAAFLKTEPSAHFLLVGKGPSEADMRAIFARENLNARLHVAGVLEPPQLIAAYHAMDVFAFASRSETQGMVLTEAMAAGVPVVGLDAPGVREVVKDRHNGRLLHAESIEDFRAALQWIAELPAERRRQLRQSAIATAEDFSMPRSAATALGCYEALRARALVERTEEDAQWEHVLHLIEAEWAILKGMAGAAVAAFGGPEARDRGLK